MDLSIIIVNWKSVAYCADCIHSIHASPFQGSYEIIVIDNASYDGCDKMLESLYPNVKFIQGKTNAGFARANNLAFQYSTGEKVCFLNPDTKILGSALQTLYDSIDGNPKGGAAGAILRNGDGSLQTSCVLPFPTLLNQALDMEWLRKRFPSAKLFGAQALYSNSISPQSVEAISGACIMTRRQTFIDVGMFGPEYFMYAEDVDLCRKIRMSGKKIYLIKEAQIIHYGGGSSQDRKSSLVGAVLMRESNYKMLRKFRGTGYALLYRTSMAVMGMARIAGLLLFLAPAAAVGNGRIMLQIMRRWWHLLTWAIGINRLPISMNPITADL